MHSPTFNKPLPVMTGNTTLTRHEGTGPFSTLYIGLVTRGSTIHHLSQTNIITTLLITTNPSQIPSSNSRMTLVQRLLPYCSPKINKALLSKKNRAAAQASYEEIYEASSPETKRCLILAQEKGAPPWLTSKPIEEHDFILIKQSLRDSPNGRYLTL